MIEVKHIGIDEWKAEGERLFGADILQWEFRCPSCGHIQKPADFYPYRDRGATPALAYFCCIGRYDGHMGVDMLSGKSPCNYTGGGLLRLGPVFVTDEKGEEHCCFDFAREVSDGQNEH